MQHEFTTYAKQYRLLGLQRRPKTAGIDYDPRTARNTPRTGFNRQTIN